MIDANFSSSYYQTLQHFGTLPRRTDVALKRAVRKVSIWLQRQVLIILSDQTKVTQKNLKRYQRVQIKAGPFEGTVWVGLNPMPLHLSGRVAWNQKAAGARVRGSTYEGAFYRAVYGGERKVWVRTARNRTAGLTPYHQARRYRPNVSVDGGRFPVTLVGVPLQDKAPLIGAELLNQARERFERVLGQELNYELLKEGRR